MAEAKQEESVSLTITYFGIGGRGAPLRAAASVGGLSYRDKFVTFADHKAAKEAGARRWSGIPEITLHDKTGKDVATIGQSNVCLKMIGTMSGLYPKNMVQAALADELMASVEDCLGLFGPSFRAKGDEKKAMRLALMEKDKLPYWMGKFEQRLEENEARGNKNGFAVNDTMTVADIKLYYLTVFLTADDLDHIDGAALMKPCPKFTAFAAKMKAEEGIKKFEAAFAKRVEAYDKGKGASEHIVAGKNVYAEM